MARTVLRIVDKNNRNHVLAYGMWKVAEDLLNRLDFDKPFKIRYTFNGKDAAVVNSIPQVVDKAYANPQLHLNAVKKEFPNLKPSKIIHVVDFVAGENGNGIIEFLTPEIRITLGWTEKGMAE